MASFNKDAGIKCSQIESLLIKNQFEELAFVKQKRIKEHLESCDNCKKYGKILGALRTTLDFDINSSIKPDPAIKQNIINKMKSLDKDDLKSTKRIWQSVWNIFDYRIPLYQAFSFLVIILIVLFGLNSLNFSNIDDQGLTGFEEIRSTHIGIIDSLQRVNSQKIGRSIQEDSLLIRFIVTSM